ncbi:hypothetical protein [Prosthecomicrobium pneumaticum]|uniref:Uncharacterized protein n=1 Tax=Prosthecomicrobium pneumaticum TaxID=81895 RepID=A0A7W9CTU5_9HYPH|nr:hypothetical protein [Prosthecomicrobium pneumaticum]MBB5751534.1 hypothetical protein [Prosthecomicrobium pneumaticum]
MTHKPPPVPPESRSPKGTGDATGAPLETRPRGDTTPNPDERGHQADSKINTTHQGHQQDR